MKKKSFKQLTDLDRSTIQRMNYDEHITISNICKELCISEVAVKQVLNEFPDRIYFKVKPIDKAALLKRINDNSFKDYYSNHSKKDTLSHFSLTEQEFKLLLKEYNFRKSSHDIYEIRKRTNLERFGIDNVFRDTEKIRKSMLDKYGVEHNSQMVGFNERREVTIKNRYGSREAFEQIQLEKREKTNIERYGYKTRLADPIIVKQIREDEYSKYGSKEAYVEHIKEKQRKTIIDKYGSMDNFLNYIKERQSGSILKNYRTREAFNNYTKQQFQKSYMDKYGYNTPFRNPQVINKCRKTNLNKYGVDNLFKSKEFQIDIHEKRKQSIKNKIIIEKGEHYYNLYNDKEYLKNVLLKYDDKPTLRQFARDNNIEYYTAQLIIARYNLNDYIKHEKSHYEDDICEYISEILPGIEIKRNVRGVLSSGKELDIYLPDYYLAIEFNGTY